MHTSSYDSDLVLDALKSRVGFKTPTNANYSSLVDCAKFSSYSGRYYNDGSYHNAVTIENILSCQQDVGIDTEAEVTTLLSGMIDANVHKALNLTINTSQVEENGILYRKERNVQYSSIANSTNFVGLRFRIKEGDIALQISNLLLHFDSDKTFNIYLYNEFAGLCETWQVTTVANKQTIVPIDTLLRYRAEEAEGGEYYIGYFQEDLGDAKAIDYHPLRNIYCYFNCMGFSSEKTGAATFDMEAYNEYYDRNYGINASVTVFQDLTNSIIQNVHVFDELLGLIMASTVIELMLTSTRSNAIERLGRDYAVTLNRELNNITTETNPYELGLRGRIRKEVKKVRDCIVGEDKKGVLTWA